MNKKLLIEIKANNISQTKEFAQSAIQYFNKGDIILLYGNLGSGKTFLTREFVRLLGLKTDVTSPSFAIINQYTGSLLVNHIDLYRISTIAELDNLGLDDLWNMNGISFIEWPNLIAPNIYWKHFRIYINFSQRYHLRIFKLYMYFNI